MSEEQPLSREAFNSMAAAAGLDVSGEHGEELFRVVQGTLAGLQSLTSIDVAGAEPDMVFLPKGTEGR